MNTPTIVHALQAAAVVAAFGLSHAAAAQSLGPAVCGDLQNAYGPLDYRKVDRSKVEIVTTYHFPPQVEALKSGGAGYLGSDIDYTLRALPNYPRALLSVARYATKTKSVMPPNLRYPAECYFERAVRFAPDDPMPHVIWAIFLRDRNRLAEAKRQVDQAVELRGDSSSFDLNYNIGLIYFDLKDYDRSMAAATLAYGLGAPLPALRNKLKSVGKWQDPPPVTVAPAATPPPPN